MCEIVSVIITIFNGAKWIENCFKSILSQNLTQITDNCKAHCSSNEYQEDYSYYPDSNRISVIEICVFDDASNDNTREILMQWKEIFAINNIKLNIFRNPTNKPKGVGFGRNAAIKKAVGTYLCFQDIDDIMLPNRIISQYILARENKNAIIGSKFIRLPENSTCRFNRWANNMSEEKLNTQIYTSNGPTVIMPTWFFHRRVYDKISEGFSENGKGTPEDLIFFYKHLDNGGIIKRFDEVLLIYRYHLNATTFSISEETIWQIRLKRLLEKVLNKREWLNGFTIWNAGKQGRKFFRDIPNDFKKSVKCFCDVDQKKINKNYNYFDEVKRQITYSIPIEDFKTIKPPFIACIKLDLTNGNFEQNLQSLNLIEGKDYIIFS